MANLIKEDGAWKLYRFQSTLDPVDNVFVHDTVKYTRLIFGGGGVAIGALLGLVPKVEPNVGFAYAIEGTERSYGAPGAATIATVYDEGAPMKSFSTTRNIA